MIAEESTELATRIDKICADKKLTYNKLAKLLGISSTTFYQLTSGRTKQLSLEVLIKFNQVLDIDIAWLATGEGEMYSVINKVSEKSVDVSNFGEQVLNEVSKGMDELKGFFEEELRAKNLQIASLQESQKSLQEMLKMVLGKHKGVPSRPNRTLTLQQSSNQGVYALPVRTN